MNNAGFIKGILTGMVVGAAVSMAVNPVDVRKMRSMKKNVGKTMRAVGQAINSIT